MSEDIKVGDVVATAAPPAPVPPGCPAAESGDWRPCGGGWVHVGARIGDGARIGVRAEVGNGAVVGDWAEVGNGARIGVRAQVGDGAVVGKEAEFERSPLLIQGTRHAAYHVGPGVLGIGCVVLPIAEWRARCGEIGARHSYTAAEVEEYREYIELIARRDAALFGAPDAEETAT